LCIPDEKLARLLLASSTPGHAGDDPDDKCNDKDDKDNAGPYARFKYAANNFTTC